MWMENSFVVVSSCVPLLVTPNPGEGEVSLIEMIKMFGTFNNVLRHCVSSEIESYDNSFEF